MALRPFSCFDIQSVQIQLTWAEPRHLLTGIADALARTAPKGAGFADILKTPC